MVLQALSPATAQTGNQSDATGPIPSTSDAAGNLTQPLSGSQTVFQGANTQVNVNQAAATVTTQLSTNTLTTSTGSAIPAPAQQNVLNVLTDGTTQAASVEAVSTALSTAPGAPPPAVVQNLLANLQGLLKDRKVTPAKLLAAIRAYNAMILASNEEFLKQPPAELIAIRAALDQMIAAASSS